MQLIDTHCHIHEADPDFVFESESHNRWAKAGRQQPDDIIADATTAAVTKMICVGTSVVDSIQATSFVRDRDMCWASIGIHPHEASQPYNWLQFAALATNKKVIAVGECGLDYFYHHATPQDQAIVLRKQIELALEHNLPLIFHTRDAFDDFWPIFDEYDGIQGVLHSFTDITVNLEKALERGLFIGVNGIATFTKEPSQLEMYKTIPLQNLLLETDAPFLTPNPFRGKICEPKHVKQTAEFLAQLRGEPIAELAAATSRNAETLFGLT